MRAGAVARAAAVVAAAVQLQILRHPHQQHRCNPVDRCLICLLDAWRARQSSIQQQPGSPCRAACCHRQEPYGRQKQNPQPGRQISVSSMVWQVANGRTHQPSHAVKAWGLAAVRACCCSAPASAPHCEIGRGLEIVHTVQAKLPGPQDQALLELFASDGTGHATPELGQRSEQGTSGALVSGAHTCICVCSCVARRRALCSG